MSVKKTVAALVLAFALAGCGGGDSTTTVTSPSTVTLQGPGPAKSFAKYLDALNAKDGAAVCQLIAPAGQEKLRPPAKRESCAEGVSASIGHPGPGGLKWASAKVTGAPQVKTAGNTATVTVTVSNTYTDGMSEPADEVVAMQHTGDGWLLAEPEDTLYRAIGQK